MAGVIQSALLGGYPTPAPVAPPTVQLLGNIQAPVSGTYNFTSAGIAGNYLDNDIIFVLINTANETPPSTPAGWTYLTSYGTGTVGDAASVGLHAAWIRANGTVGNAAFGDPANLNLIARGMVIRGCKTSGTPVVVLDGIVDSVSEPVSLPVADTTTAQNLILHTIIHSQSSGVAFTENWSSPNLTSGAEQFSGGTTLEHGGGLAAYSGIKATAGSLGSPTVEIKGIAQPQNFARATYAFLP